LVEQFSLKELKELSALVAPKDDDDKKTQIIQKHIELVDPQKSFKASKLSSSIKQL
jgi:hypothetical protein